MARDIYPRAGKNSNEGVAILLALYRHRYLERAKEMSEAEAEELVKYFCGTTMAENDRAEWLRRKYRQEGLGLKEIGAILNMTPSGVARQMERFGIPRRPRGIMRGTCKSPATKARMSRAKMAEGNPRWGGGRKHLSDGYIMLKMPGHPEADTAGYIMEHRLVMERELNRYLTPQEVVHHINGDLADNRIENLMLFASNVEHLAFHREEEEDAKDREDSP